MNKLSLVFQQEHHSEIVFTSVENFDQLIAPYQPDKVIFIIDQSIKNIHRIKTNYSASWFFFEAREENKSIDYLLQLIDFITSQEISKNSLLVAIGGGLISDITGFAASILLRGIKYINIPTSFVAQIDSAIGGKTAVNYISKNWLGSFHFPSLVIIDQNFLTTLSEGGWADGMAELAKYAIISSHKLFSWLLLNHKLVIRHEREAIEFVTRLAVACKLQIVENDPYERKINGRCILNFGHTIGHAIEIASKHYYSHGQAVAMGMWLESQFALEQKLISQEVFAKINELLQKLEINYNNALLTSYKEEIVQAIKYDKKNMHKQIGIVIPVKIGMAELHYFPHQTVADFLYKIIG